MIEHPEVGPAKWAAGTASREPASVLVNDAKFHNQSYVKNQKYAAAKAFNIEVFGSHVAVAGVDAAFELFSTIENWNNMCYDNCLGSAHKRRYIVLATEEMQERIVGVSNPFQSDPIEGYFKSVFYTGQVYLLVT